MPAELDFDFVPPSDTTSNNDAANAILVHRSLGPLSAAQASDERLWAYVTHVDFWPYMRDRWPIERFVDPGKAARFVLARYFVPQSQGRALLRNGIARLWWGAHLTIDRNRDNPYELTEVLFSKLDIAKNILERSMGRSRVVRTAFLDFLNLHADRLLAPGEKGRREIRALSRFLNLTGGVNMLDGLNEADLVELLNRELETLEELSEDSEPTDAS